MMSRRFEDVVVGVQMDEEGPSPRIVKLQQDLATNPRSFVPLVHAYLQSDQLGEAIRFASKGVRDYPDYVAGWGVLGQVCIRKKDVSGAKEAFQRVIALNPSHVQAHKQLALLCKEEGKTALARQSLKKVLEIDPSDREAKAALAEWTIPEPSVAPSDADTPGAHEDVALPPAVVSPILAALYAHQGHHKEAAAVYRALAIQDSSDDRKSEGVAWTPSDTVRLRQAGPASEGVPQADPPGPNARRLRRLRKWLSAIQAEKAGRST